MKSVASLLLCLSIATTCLGADEPDKRTPLERYRGDGEGYVLICSLSLKLALARAEHGVPQDNTTDFAGCIHERKAWAKAAFDKALKSVRKTKAQEALKTYHVALITALEGIRPGIEELKVNYEQRQQALGSKLTEAWTRFEVEQ